MTDHVVDYEMAYKGVTVQLDMAEARIKELEALVERKDAALARIEKWFGEFPKTGRYWDKQKTEEMSYAAAFGSNGERDYMRAVARNALATHSSTERGVVK